MGASIFVGDYIIDGAAIWRFSLNRVLFYFMDEHLMMISSVLEDWILHFSRSRCANYFGRNGGEFWYLSFGR